MFGLKLLIYGHAPGWLLNAKWMRDWLRGYRDEDIISVAGKLYGPHSPNSIIPVTQREMAASIWASPERVSATFECTCRDAPVWCDYCVSRLRRQRSERSFQPQAINRI